MSNSGKALTKRTEPAGLCNHKGLVLHIEVMYQIINGLGAHSEERICVTVHVEIRVGSHVPQCHNTVVPRIEHAASPV